MSDHDPTESMITIDRNAHLTHSTADDFQFCMTWDVKEYWASQGMIENGGFMEYLGPFIEIVRGLLNENTATGGATASH